MRFHNITHDDMLNGTGMRVVLWVAGCNHRCAECQNYMTWDSTGGIDFTLWEEAEFYEWLSKPWTEGATFSGGDPLHPMNRAKVGQMCRVIKKKYPKKNIWLYTGYVLEKNENDCFVFMDEFGKAFSVDWLSLVDIVVDGKFEANTRRNDIAQGDKLYWRGSSNQRVINVKETIVSGRIMIATG